ncbi:formate C-acetyltransferase [Spiroplasma chrysopicola DF-1]|uniref:Formate acetyltransferase n=1 Tax=Spiroplasma chrysopicola DF-1 TaxID=1276227 RepID=R4UGJ4_9MOLU|nr:formate C-acetyltransferase [Spiroplasma chrysopicola]AGM25245.1 formate C-acetyltransferase [Spiroplasma chrysopicola DF-1]
MTPKWFPQWEGFNKGEWTSEIDVRNFIQKNYRPYEGDDQFLTLASEATNKLWAQIRDLTAQEIKKGGVLDADTAVAASITAHDAGYLDKKLEVIVGLQTDKPFKRAIMPNGGIRVVKAANESYGYSVDPKLVEIFEKYRKSHNQAVFDAYTDEIKACRKSSIITGLPDSYGRGRIIGDYRRLALYGADFLIAQKEIDKKNTSKVITEEVIRLREEITEQIRALNDIKLMAQKYGFDVSQPAQNAREAFQWTYFAYLAAIKENNGAAMSFGRTAGFLDIYIERDFVKGILTEQEAQELVDHMIMKLRIVKFMRAPEYNQLFSGDPVWATESIGGMGLDGRSLVTKNAYRYIHTLSTMGPSPEPNLTILWSKNLPSNFKKFCAKYSIKYSSMQYENDDIMRINNGDDYAIACCVSPLTIGKEMQFFGARCNLVKTLLYAINGGIDEISKVQISPRFEPCAGDEETPLNFSEVWYKFEQMADWLSGVYCDALNIIHYMHDKYFYERSQLCFMDSDVKRLFATGVAGLAVVTDSLSAIKHAKVYPIKDENNIVVDYRIEGEYPCYGNNDDRVDQIAVDVVKMFMTKVRRQQHYRNSFPSMSVLTITSNVVYGKATGNSPDGRRAGVPFSPGANPMNGRDNTGAVNSLLSVSKLPFRHAEDGISNTFSIIPNALGKDGELAIELDGDPKCCVI